MYDLVVKGGVLIDPAVGIYERKDIGILDGRVEVVETRIPAEAKQVLDADGLIVTPGLVDLHVHVCHDIASLGIDPDAFCLHRGSTTVLDAGSLGHLLFKIFKTHVIDVSKTTVYALLNIKSLGMIEFSKKEGWSMLIDALDGLFAQLFVNTEETLRTLQENKNVILGLKWAHNGLEYLRLARKVADEAGCLIMAENHRQPDALKYLKKGDIVTHLYHGLKPRPHDGLLDDDMKVQPEFYEAIKRGVILDVGHGAGSFSWDVAEKALEQGIKPHTISTDLYTLSVNGPAFDMPTTMAKFLHLGLSLEEVVEASTATPAKVLGKLGEIGTLKPGAFADLVVFKMEEGKFPLTDTMKQTRIGRKMPLPVAVVKRGEVLKLR
jgi:dihydroorotase